MSPVRLGVDITILVALNYMNKESTIRWNMNGMGRAQKNKQTIAIFTFATSKVIIQERLNI